jgi:hypothetical protein
MVQDATLKQKIEGYVKNVQVLRSQEVSVEGEKIVRVTVGTRMYGNDTAGGALLQKMCAMAEENQEVKAVPTPVTVDIPKEEPKPVEVTPATEEPKAVVAKTTATATSEPATTVVVHTKVIVRNVKAKPKAKPVVKHTPKPKLAPVKTFEGTAEITKTNGKSTTVETRPISVAAMASSEPKPAETTPAVQAGYTSVIIDTVGLNVLRAMSPKIRASSGDEVWGTLKMDPDEIQDHGPVAYVRTIVDAKKCPRAGANPLELKAVGRAGGSRMCDVVLSDEDVAKLKAADLASQPPFLAALKVILVVDPAKAFASL